MSLDTLAAIALILAAIPAGLFVLNLLVYRPLPSGKRPERSDSGRSWMPSEPVSLSSQGISVLIPARNEESNIRSTLEAVLLNGGVDFEVIVLDDHSTDRTAAIVGEFSTRDSRVRLLPAPPLPPGWCGKQHACHALAKLARHSLLVFMDADVRLAPDALQRMAEFMEPCGQSAGRSAHSEPLRNSRRQVDPHSGFTRRPALASGVPRQELGTFSERLLLPLIHFILLGFLPMHAMRRTRWPSMSAGCGQLFIARRDAYERCGGHAKLRDSLHDGIKLPRVFRKAGFRTDLFDATDLATCRMYHTNAETWRGLGKNATEGIAAPDTIVPMTALLVGGQLLPFVLLAGAPMLSTAGLSCAIVAGMLVFAPRLISVWRFRQPLGSALLHPLGVLALLMIQWHALGRHLLGKPSEWKGRSYGATSGIHPLKVS
jgi:GT2 family glycosyltransferase